MFVREFVYMRACVCFSLRVCDVSMNVCVCVCKCVSQ